MTEEKTKEVTCWAKPIAAWCEIPQAWVWHLAEYHPEIYEEIRDLMEYGDEILLYDVLGDDGIVTALILLETIKQREGCEEWAQQVYRAEFGHLLSKVGYEDEFERANASWQQLRSMSEARQRKGVQEDE